MKWTRHHDYIRTNTVCSLAKEWLSRLNGKSALHFFETEKTMQVKGRNLITGLPESIEVSSIEIRDALSNSVQVIIDTMGMH